ncbi:hypothetical protein [Kordia jejudonensis]|uniref:hypothetical protein n=1 Tax=Kordia jejudonensis TaxID=1348245 RepID=UPI000629472C|nr:hypothetical protein [Kordia jejudonensis]
MKQFRKPYLSIFLVILLLFTSCQPQLISEIDKSENIENTFSKNLNQSITIEDFVTNHISIIDSYLTNPNEYANSQISLITELEAYVNYNSLVTELSNNNIDNPEQFANMYLLVQNNTNNFLNNFNFGKLTPEEIENIILNEISKQLKQTYESEHNTCGYIHLRAIARCERNFYASLAAVAVSTFWSFGVGTAIGVAAAGAIVLTCVSDANSDFRQCLANSY